VVLSGHTDVVPVAGQPWTSDPFQMVQRDGRLYARGTSDMKSFIAIALALVPVMLTKRLALPIHFALSYDEELGCTGAPPLLADLAKHLAPPALAIIGEPTEMGIGDRHKGFAAFETVVTGRDGHSSATHRGVNAIAAAAAIVQFLETLAEEFRTQGPFDEHFDPPYTTINYGQIEGGQALNIIARRCRIGWETRPVAGVTADDVRGRLDAFIESELLARLRRVAPESSIAVENLCVVPGLLPDPRSPAVALMRRLTGANSTAGLAYGTEAGMFQAAGMSAVVCGPGSIAQAHQPDEFIALTQVAACAEILGRLIDWAAEPR
jgi:acetylornithine deacetylase